MIHAYNKEYVSDAMENLGEAFDYAVNAQNLSLNQFSSLFINSNVSKSFENGNPKYVSGISGTELVLTVLNQTGLLPKQHKSLTDYDRSSEYWTGWILAYYQWYSGRKYSDIFKVLSFEDLQKMYYTLHEADITKFVDIVDSKIKEYFSETNLKRIRTAYGFTQAELAERSGVSLRSIQMYEQRNKNINKASADSMYSLAKALGCTMENLIER